MKNKILIYQTEESSMRLEVRVDDETVWLNRHQLADLFNRDINTATQRFQLLATNTFRFAK